MTFLHLVNEFDAGDREGRRIKTFEPQHQPHSLFDAPVVRVKQGVEIPGRPDKEILRPGRSLLEFGLAVYTQVSTKLAHYPHELEPVTNDTYITATETCALLRQLAALNLGVPLTVVLDNARYQRCAQVMTLAASLHIELCFLPPYSPNLNLIERLWKFVKKQCLSPSLTRTSPRSKPPLVSA